MHRGNSIIAFGNWGSNLTPLPMAQTQVPPQKSQVSLGFDYLNTRLEDEIQSIINAGHLRTGYVSHGIFNQRSCGDQLVDYWHNSAETIITLLLARPHVSIGMQQQIDSYVQNEFSTYPPYQYNHIGWLGAARENFILPEDLIPQLSGPQTENYTFRNNGGWGRNPYLFYALWKYAQQYGNAPTIYQNSKNSLESPPLDDMLVKNPHMHNAVIAGYIGYLELEKLAGASETTSVRNELNRLLQLRTNTFTVDSAYGDIDQIQNGAYCRTLNIANNFMFLVPELADYLSGQIPSAVQAAVDEYERLAPYWFVSFAEEGFAENSFNPLYDAHSLFIAKALILEESGTELEKYLDVPGFARGDLYYIQKLVAILEATPFSIKMASPSFYSVKASESAIYTIQVQRSAAFTHTITLVSSSPSPDLQAQLAPTSFSKDVADGIATLTLTDLHDSSFKDGVWYTVNIVATGGDIQQTLQANLLVNGKQTFLPFIMKN
jgi:hypothetical protein